MRMVNEPVGGIVTKGNLECRARIRTDLGNATIRLSRSKGPFPTPIITNRGLQALERKRRDRPGLISGRDAVYIPAARLGTIQFFTNILSYRNQMFSRFVRTFGGIQEYKENSQLLRREGTAALRELLGSVGRLPLYLEDFYDLYLRFLSSGDTENIADTFRSFHEGQIQLEKRREFPTVIFVDKSGYTTEIEAAGSGVVASLPIAIGLREVNKGGMLVIEEPEAHLEPYRQILVLTLLCREAIRRKLTLVLTTHSDYIVKKTLGLVAKGGLKNSNLGLHYFDRTGRFTKIRHIDVSKAGEAEQPAFDQAIRSLISDFSA